MARLLGVTTMPINEELVQRLQTAREVETYKQLKRDAINYYLKQGHSIEQAIYMADYKPSTSLN